MTRGAARVVHRTRYAFDDGVGTPALVETCLEPPDTSFHQLVVRPLPANVEVATDRFGNRRHRVSFDVPMSRLEFTAISVLSDVAGAEVLDPRDFLEPSPRAPMLEACTRYARGCGLQDLVAQVSRDFCYDRSATDLSTPLADFVTLRRGVCQDFAHFTIACLRSLDIPARYVSGYSAASAKTGRTHAWVRALVAGSWVDVDPTTAQIGQLDHIAVATGRDYDDVPLLRGIIARTTACRVSSSITISADG